MASLTPAEYDYATNLDWEKLPNRLRCAVCNKAVVDAMKTDCCDTTICGICSKKLSGNCPVCEHKISSDMTREDKRTRTTLKAHIKGELQKRNNAAAAAATAAAKEASSAVVTPEVQKEVGIQEQVTAPKVLSRTPQALKSEDAQQASVDAVVDTSSVEPNGHVVSTLEPEADADEDNDEEDIEIITERPDQAQSSFGRSKPLEENTEEEIQQEEQQEEEEQDDPQQSYQQEQQVTGFDDTQQGFMNFAAMNGFNPMMAMQGMGMPPFGMMPNMMGMPNMGMDHSMMFNGGFPGLNGMMSMMNGNMMNGFAGMPNMGDMNDYNNASYNNQYGNRFDNRGQQFPQSNRGYGRGAYGNNFRGRGQGFFRGRSRGNWQQGQQHFQQQQHYQGNQQDYDMNEDFNAVEPAQASFEREGHAESRADDSHSDHATNGVHAVPLAPKTYDTDDLKPREDAETRVQTSVEGDHKHEGNDQQYNNTREETPALARPVNAPTGPRAMREGLPNSGRFSRPQTEVRPISRDASIINAPTGPSSKEHAPIKAPTGPSSQRRQDTSRDDRRSITRSRSPSRHEHKHKRHRSRSPREDDDTRYSRDEERQRRKDRKRDRTEDKEYYEKRKRSGSVTSETDSRRHRHRDDKERSRRDRSREKHRGGTHRSREDDVTADVVDDDDGYDDRRRSKSHRSSRRDREDKYDKDFPEIERPVKPASHPRAVLEEPQDEIGFKIKGTKSGQNATAVKTPTTRDPYAEERERMKEQRLQRDAERRQGTTSSGKRGREDANGHDEYGGRKKRSKPRAKYEDEVSDHEREREKQRWR